ncbi:MAG: hypothetical protein ACKVXR_10980 [Planctomycetota bacterium]
MIPVLLLFVASASSQNPATGGGPPSPCVSRIRDQATGGCLLATSVPTPGMLFPPPHDGGEGNEQNGVTSFVGSGQYNVAEGALSMIGGGLFNQALGSYSVVGGGYFNGATANYATIGGGESNTASDWYTTIAGGEYNTALGRGATVGGGFSNSASGTSATVPGGSGNVASAWYSFAAGGYAKAIHSGSFVWGDGNSGDKQSTADNQFSVFARGGVRFLDGTTPTLVIDPEGRVGIGTATPSGSLEVRRSLGDVKITGLGAAGEGSVAWGAPRGKTGVRGVSDGAGTESDILWTDEGIVLAADQVHVTGLLTKGGGAFTIDHPLDPRNKVLSHSFVESPDMMNVYNGNAVLDERGEAWIELPEWFEALNRDFRYQLTAIGAPGPDLHVATKIEGRRFRIAGGKGDLEVSWQVTGIRRDPFANANRVKVEEEKSAAQRGRYLHPEAYGEAETVHSAR